MKKISHRWQDSFMSHLHVLRKQWCLCFVWFFFIAVFTCCTSMDMRTHLLYALIFALTSFVPTWLLVSLRRRQCARTHLLRLMGIPVVAQPGRRTSAPTMAPWLPVTHSGRLYGRPHLLLIIALQIQVVARPQTRVSPRLWLTLKIQSIMTAGSTRS